MKSRNKLIDELEENGYNYEFVLNNLTKNQEKKVLEFILIEKQLSNDGIFDTSLNTLKNISILVYDDKKNIIALSVLEKILLPTINLYFFDFSYYVGKKFRTKGIKPSIIHKILYPLSYFESYEYIIQNKIKDFYGLTLYIANDKLMKKYVKNVCTDLDEYYIGTYIGNRRYIWYYPNMTY
jgi:hypothetical protein